VAVAFQDVHPPLAVVDAYRDVSRATSESQTRRNQGLAYQAERLALAQGLAAAAVQRATASSESRLARACGAAEAFLARQQARAGQPALADLRLYWETIATTLAGKTKLVLEPAPGLRRHFLISEPPAPALNAALPLVMPGAAAVEPKPAQLEVPRP
jgi:P-type Cu+ transporter